MYTYTGLNGQTRMVTRPDGLVQPSLTQRAANKTAQELYRDTLALKRSMFGKADPRPSSGYGKKIPSIHPSGRLHGENIFPRKCENASSLQPQQLGIETLSS
eukprot:scaffold311923_cov39-Prasinocladus_malaysianus.AAC.1